MLKPDIEVERDLFEKHFGPKDNFAWRNADGSYQVYAIRNAWEIWQAARSVPPSVVVVRELSDEQLWSIAIEQDYGDEDQKCILRLMRAVIAADRLCDAEAVGEIVANDPVQGWHMRALKPWNEIGEGTLLYAGLPPRVTQSMVDAQNRIIDQMEKSKARIDALRTKYGINDVITYTVNGEVMRPLEYIDYLHGQLSAMESLRAGLQKIATVNAMDYEYQRWAHEALNPEIVSAKDAAVHQAHSYPCKEDGSPDFDAMLRASFGPAGQDGAA